MKKTTLKLLLAVYIATFTFSARAAERFSFSLYPGVYLNGVNQRFTSSIGESRARDTFLNMFMYGLRAGYELTDDIEAELDFMYSPTKSGPLRMFTYYTSVHGLYNFRISKSLVPYVLVGPGVLRVNVDQVSQENKLGIGFGAGVKLFLTESFALRPEVRGVTTFNSTNLAFLGSLMLTYYMDPSKTNSSESASPAASTNQGDLPPVVAPAPSKDTDNDGFPDTQDRCPNEPEVVNGFEDSDGCPDTAPQLPKAFIDPNIDTDKDGIPDSKDQCPKEPETFNSYQDQDGCPDSVPVELKKFAGKMEGINFASGSSIIQKNSYKILDETVAILKKYPKLHIKIEGHTDSVGRVPSNLKLSSERAESVRQYLTSRGIDIARLDIEGFGSKMPVTSNSTSTGRAQNRRIEFKIEDKSL